MKAAEEVDLSIESHTEEVETENTVLVKNSIAFECDECSYRNNSEKGLHKHKRMKHRISQTDGADDHELEESEIPVRSAEEMKKASDFIRKYVMTSTMMKHDKMWCYKCNNRWFNKIFFKTHMMNSHGQKICIDIKHM